MSFINLLSIIYPVGAVYLSVNPVSPSQIIGGTWTEIDDGNYLRAAGNNTPVTSTGGNSEVSHSHEAGELRASIGAVNSNIYSLGYEPVDPYSSARPQTNLGIIGNQAPPSGSTFNHGTKIRGNSGNTTIDIIPPYTAVYIWYRVS